MSIRWNKAPENPTEKHYWKKYLIYAPRDGHPSNGIYVGYYDDIDDTWHCGDEFHRIQIKPEDVKLICEIDIDEIATCLTDE